MNWFRSSPKMTQQQSLQLPNLDEACLEVFRSHWLQILAIVERPIDPGKPIATNDDVDTVLHHLQQMILLLVEEKSEDGQQGRILDYLLTEDILEKTRQWSNCIGENRDRLKLELLKTFEVLITQSLQPLLVHKPIIRPLLHLLNSCGDSEVSMIQKRMIFLLHQLCVCLTLEPQLLELFFTASQDQGATKFLVFSLLIPYVHHEGLVGQQARDALLLIMALSSRNESIGKYIAENSDFCPVLATGLSGLYSSLPRKLEMPSDDWCRLCRDDWSRIPDLVMFINSLEFCNAVVQAAHPLVRNQLLSFIYNGFLVPVLGPALHQDLSGMPLALIELKQFRNSLEEVIAATAYLDLFIRRVTEPALIRQFLRFVLTEKHDEIIILDSLITRINSNSRLCMVSLALFKTLVDLHCEEVMFQLVFKYLVPCTHVMVSQRRNLQEEDIYGKSSEKFLSLTPACCLPDVNDSPQSNSQPNTPELKRPVDGSGDQSTAFPPGSHGSKLEHYETCYTDYLQDAQARVEHCWRACAGWSAPYDGKNPPPDAYLEQVNNTTRRRAESDSAKTKVKVTFNDAKPNLRIESHGQVDRRPSLELKHALKCSTLAENCESPGKECNSSGEECRSPGEECKSPGEKCQTPVEECQSDEVKSCSCDTEVSRMTEDLGSFFQSLNRVTTPTEYGDNLDESMHQLDAILDQLPDTAGTTHDDGDSTARQRTFSEFESGASAHEQLLSLQSQASSNSRDCSPETGTAPGQVALRSERPANHPRSLTTVQEPHAVPNIGPFLTVLLQKLDGLMHNSLYVNLLLTDLLAELASHPQILLRSFLTSSSLIFQPSVRSMIQVLGCVKHKVDCFSYTVDNFENLLLRARRFLVWRESTMFDEEARDRSRSDSLNLPSAPSAVAGRTRAASVAAEKPVEKKRSLTNFFKKFQQSSESVTSDRPRMMRVAGGGYRFINAKNTPAQKPDLESQRTKNAVYAAIVLEEFLKELAAIAQEHAVQMAECA